MNPNQISIILTCVGSPMAWNMINAFNDAESLNIRVVGVDMNPDAIGKNYLKSFYTVPSGINSEYSDVIMDICIKEDIKIVVPGSDEEAFNLSKNKKEFDEQGIICTVPNEELIGPMSDKALMYELLGNFGITTPDFCRVLSFDDIESAAVRLGYPKNPFILKLSSNRGGRGVWKITECVRGSYFLGRSDYVGEINLEDVKYILESLGVFPPMIAMEQLEGDFYDVDVLSQDGKALYLIPRKRLNPLGIPFRGNVFENNEAIISLADNIQKNLCLTYLYDMDIAYNHEKGAQVMEVNPRPSGSAIATVEAGINLFEFLVRMALGFEVPKVDIPDGVTVLPRTTAFKV
jgi:carbamoyl-phosphate synthase large subunit